MRAALAFSGTSTRERSLMMIKVTSPRPIFGTERDSGPMSFAESWCSTWGAVWVGLQISPVGGAHE